MGVAVGLAAVVVLFVGGACRGEETAHQPVNLSFFYPLSTNTNPDISTNFRLNLFYGRVGTIRGFDLGAFVSRTDRDVRGLQLTGVYSHTGGDIHGAVFTGGLNYVGGDGRGVQVAGLVNFNRGAYRGVQYATFFNFAQRRFYGVQWAFLFNMSNEDSGPFQVATVANLTGGDFRGLQLGGVNFVNDSMRGAQVGILNFAYEYRGVQIGGLNIAEKAEGAVIGAINFVGELDGVPVGAVNLEKAGGNADWSIFASNIVLASTGLRTVVNGFVSTLGVGAGDIPEERDDTFFLSWHYGYLFPFGERERWQLSPDLGFVHIMPQSEEEGKNNDRHFALQARLTGEVRLSPRAAAFFGGGLSVRFSAYSSQASTDFDPLIVGGVTLF